MIEWLIFFWPVLLLAPPVVFYLLRVRPGIDRSQRGPLIVGMIAAVIAMLPLVGIAGWILLEIWAWVMLAFLAVHAIVWIIAAVKKKESCVGGAILTGLTMIVSGACLGNWLAVIVALLYLAVLFRSRFTF